MKLEGVDFMKKMIVAAVMLASVANAEELKFGDVNYFIKKDQSNLVFDLNQTFEEQTDKDGNTTETRGILLSPVFAYGLSDNLNLTFGFDYAYDRETEDKTDTSNADVKSDGFSNPAIGVNYRLMNQNSAMYNFDLGAIARINIEDAETGTSVGQDETEGNNAEGRSSLELNARMGRKWNEANEWQLAAGLNYFKDGEETLKETTGNREADIDSSYDLFIRATYQYRPVHEFMTLVSIQATRVGEVDADFEGAGGKVSTDAYTDFDFKFVAKYLVTENFIAKFNYGISNNSDFDFKNDGTSDEVRKRRENFFGLGVDFLF